MDNTGITFKDMIRGLQTERECVSRDCNRDCYSCDLVEDREWLLQVYDRAIEMLECIEGVKPNPVKIAKGRVLWWECPNCHEIFGRSARFCSRCGKELNWEGCNDE